MPSRVRLGVAGADLPVCRQRGQDRPLVHGPGCGSAAEPRGERVHGDVRGSPGDDAHPADGRPPRREPRPPPQGRPLEAPGVADAQRHTGWDRFRACVISPHSLQKCKKIRGIGCVNRVRARARITQPSPSIFLHFRTQNRPDQLAKCPILSLSHT